MLVDLVELARRVHETHVMVEVEAGGTWLGLGLGVGVGVGLGVGLGLGSKSRLVAPSMSDMNSLKLIRPGSCALGLG